MTESLLRIIGTSGIFLEVFKVSGLTGCTSSVGSDAFAAYGAAEHWRNLRSLAEAQGLIDVDREPFKVARSGSRQWSLLTV
jgi:hypothetical protein